MLQQIPSPVLFYEVCQGFAVGKAGLTLRNVLDTKCWEVRICEEKVGNARFDPTTFRVQLSAFSLRQIWRF